MGARNSYRAELSPAEAQRAEARRPAVQATCYSARAACFRHVLDAESANFESGFESGRAATAQEAPSNTRCLEANVASYEWSLQFHKVLMRLQFHNIRMRPFACLDLGQCMTNYLGL